MALAYRIRRAGADRRNPAIELYAGPPGVLSFVRMLVGGLCMFGGELAMLMRSGGMLLGVFMLADCMMVSGLMAMMRGGVMVSGRLMMMLGRWMLGPCHFFIPSGKD